MLRHGKPYKVAPAKEVTLYDTFEAGDLVFGLAKPRDEVIGILSKAGLTHTYSNALNSPVVELVLRGADAKTLTTLDPVQLSHYYFLLAHRDYLMRKPGKGIPARPDEPEVGAAYRRACKLLLIHRSDARKNKAHVVISDIDWDRVCDKRLSGLGVTNSEMRAAYRDYRRHGKNPHILFYNSKLQLIDPPWMNPVIAAHFRRYDESKAAASRVGMFAVSGGAGGERATLYAGKAVVGSGLSAVRGFRV